MTERTERGTPSGSSLSSGTGEPPEVGTRPPVDIEKIADKVYRMMLMDLALARERGVGRR